MRQVFDEDAYIPTLDRHRESNHTDLSVVVANILERLLAPAPNGVNRCQR